MKITLNGKDLALILEFTDIAKIKYSLNGFHINLDKKRIEAINGRRAIIYPVSIEKIDRKENCIIPAALFKSLKPKKKSYYEIEVKNSRVKITEIGSGCQVEDETIKGKFPNLDTYIPKNKTAIDTIGITTSLIPADLIGTFIFSGPIGPVRITDLSWVSSDTKLPEGTIIIFMPRKLD